jgi:hypothetical protein
MIMESSNQIKIIIPHDLLYFFLCFLYKNDGVNIESRMNKIRTTIG